MAIEITYTKEEANIVDTISNLQFDIIAYTNKILNFQKEIIDLKDENLHLIKHNKTGVSENNNAIRAIEGLIEFEAEKINDLNYLKDKYITKLTEYSLEKEND